MRVIAALILLGGCRGAVGDGVSQEQPPAAVVWIERTAPTSSAQATREPEPGRKRAPTVRRAGRQPHHFWYLHADEVPERREWVRVDPATWEERYPTGAVLRFRVIGRTREEGRAGVVVRRVPDETVDVLIPRRGLRAMAGDARGARREWHELGPMHLIE